MKSDFVVRLIGMVVFAIIGAAWGSNLGDLAGQTPGATTFTREQYAFTIGLVGALAGLILTPFLTTRPVRALRNAISHLSGPALFASLIGLIAGLIVAALLAYPLSTLPSPLGSLLPFLGALVCGYLGIVVFVSRSHDILSTLSSLFTRGASFAKKGATEEVAEPAVNKSVILLDTSVIIDGRIADIAHTGFLPGSLLIPRFVLNELQYIADSPDSLRRQRGRRGMEVLSQLQKDPVITVTISDIDVEGTREVDEKLVILARQMRCQILTNDYNLNRVAEIQGVSILNVNELSNAVKSVVLPGEPLSVFLIQEGKESNQGVGYMDDGTMVVVEYGREYVGQEVHVTVTKVLQTAAGRMIFARPDER